MSIVLWGRRSGYRKKMKKTVKWGDDQAKECTRLFWQLAKELSYQDSRIAEGMIMGGRCLRLDEEFLALVDYKGSGLVVKLPKDRVCELIDCGDGHSFGPAGRIFKEWISVPEPNAKLWRALLIEGIAFVSKT